MKATQLSPPGSLPSSRRHRKDITAGVEHRCNWVWGSRVEMVPMQALKDKLEAGPLCEDPNGGWWRTGCNRGPEGHRILVMWEVARECFWEKDTWAVWKDGRDPPGGKGVEREQQMTTARPEA